MAKGLKSIGDVIMCIARSGNLQVDLEERLDCVINREKLTFEKGESYENFICSNAGM